MSYLKQTTIAIISAIALVSCGPHIQGDGNVVKKEHDISNVNKLDINGQFRVILTQGKKSRLSIETDENLHDYITVVNKENTIRIGTEAFITDAEKLNIYVTMPHFNDIDLSGAVELTNDKKIKTKSMRIDASGATEIDLDMEIKELSIDLSGASEIKLQGSARNAEFDLSGASEIEAYEFETENMIIEISGAGNAEVFVTETLDVEISGAGEVKYKGEPEIDDDISGAGNIEKVK
ncbi:DUF2807 domain-containing protein [Flavobacteriales bacterium]|nr:DUF2807 domain-containing protein [Flavobacteriales bacterium]